MRTPHRSYDQAVTAADVIIERGATGSGPYLPVAEPGIGRRMVNMAGLPDRRQPDPSRLPGSPAGGGALPHLTLPGHDDLPATAAAPDLGRRGIGAWQVLLSSAAMVALVDAVLAAALAALAAISLAAPTALTVALGLLVRARCITSHRRHGCGPDIESRPN